MNAGEAVQLVPRIRKAVSRNELPPPCEFAARQPLLLIPFSIGFYFSFRTVIALIAVRLFLQESWTGAGVSLTIEFVLLLMTAFQAIGPSVRPLDWLFQLSNFRWVIAFLSFTGCSLAWSRTVSLPTSFVYWCGLVADVTLVILLLRAAPIEVIAHSLMKGFIWATCMLALIAWMMPVGPDLRLGDLEYFNTNQIGNLCALAIFQTQYLICRKEWKSKPVMILLIVTLVRSLSKTTLVAFLVSETYLIARDRSISRKSKLRIAGAVLAVALMFWGLFQSYYSVYTSTGNQAQTLTGRLAIWSFSLNAALERPWIGNGFDSMWKVFPPFGSDQFEARHSENELLQQFFAYGLVGIAMLYGLYGSLFRSIRRLPPGSMRTTFLSLLLFILIRGFAEAEPFDLLMPLWMMTVLSSIAASSQSTERARLHSAHANSAGGIHQLCKRHLP